MHILLLNLESTGNIVPCNMATRTLTMLIPFMQLRLHHKEIITRDGLLIDQFIRSMTPDNIKPLDVIV